ncbi:MAG: hypothetical protein ACYTBP_13900 [Planctomycetota bacterium]|jgi:hypothetical protein
MNGSDENRQQHYSYREMTVAHIRERTGRDHVEVVFLESTRFYRLNRENPNFQQTLRLLREAMAKGDVVDVGLTSPHSEIIQEVRKRDSDAPTPGPQTGKDM